MKEKPALKLEDVVVWHLNVRGWRTKEADVAALVRLATKKPDVLCLNETFLDKALPEV